MVTMPGYFYLMRFPHFLQYSWSLSTAVPQYGQKLVSPSERPVVGAPNLSLRGSGSSEWSVISKAE